MIDLNHIDDLARRLSGLVPPGLRESREELQENFKAVLQSGLAKLDLVTREEFDVQRAVLLRTREKLEQLQGRVLDLETRLATGDGSSRTDGCACRHGSRARAWTRARGGARPRREGGSAPRRRIAVDVDRRPAGGRGARSQGPRARRDPVRPVRIPGAPDHRQPRPRRPAQGLPFFPLLWQCRQ